MKYLECWGGILKSDASFNLCIPPLPNAKQHELGCLCSIKSGRYLTWEDTVLIARTLAKPETFQRSPSWCQGTHLTLGYHPSLVSFSEFCAGGRGWQLSLSAEEENPRQQKGERSHPPAMCQFAFQTQKYPGQHKDFKWQHPKFD